MCLCFLKKNECLPFLIYEHNKPGSAGERCGGEAADAWRKGHDVYNTVTETLKTGKWEQSSRRRDICIARNSHAHVPASSLPSR